MMHRNLFRIEICGGIASGKTTLANLLLNENLNVINEKFELNPFLVDFYKNPEYFSFETEICFLLQHYHQIKVAQLNGLNSVCDFSFILDKAYCNVTVSKQNENNIINKLIDEIYLQVSHPDLVVYLKCPPDILLERIVTRDRTMEQNISVDYISNIIKELELALSTVKSQILVIDSNSIDFASDPIGKQKVIDLILKTSRELYQ